MNSEESIIKDCKSLLKQSEECYGTAYDKFLSWINFVYLLPIFFSQQFIKQ